MSYSDFRAKNPGPIRSYADLFGGEILDDELYETADGFARIWTVKTDKGIDHVHFLPSTENYVRHFHVESSGLEYGYAPHYEELGNAECGDYEHHYLVPPKQHAVVKRFQQLGWELLGVRTLDDRVSTGYAAQSVTQSTCHIAPCELYMCRSWILAHPTLQVIFKMTLCVNQSERLVGYISPAHATWSWRMARGQLSGYNVGSTPKNVGAYIHAGYGDFTRTPDVQFANLLDEITAPRLPFRQIWYDDMAETYCFHKDTLEAPLLQALKDRTTRR